MRTLRIVATVILGLGLLTLTGALALATSHLKQLQPVPLPLPDLVVTMFDALGPAGLRGDHVEVPVSVGVKNQGNAPAGIFKVSVEYTRPGGGPYGVAFGSGWYRFTTGPLAPGAVAYSKDYVIFPPAVRGVSVTLHAVADSCAGDEFKPDYCRVREGNEGNNRSMPVPVTLP